MFAQDSKHLVIGFGITGLSIAKALAKIGVGEIWAMDSRETPPNHEQMLEYCDELEVGRFNPYLLDHCDYLWVSPGVAIATPELQPCIERLPKDHVGGDIELFARLIRENIIAITGTNGKSTVTTLVGEIFKESPYDLYVGGNLGTPALDLWIQYSEREPSDEREALFVLELSSFQLETTDSLKADVGVVLNLSPDHLDRYRNYQHYIDSKFRLFAQSETVIVPAAEPLIEEALRNPLWKSYAQCFHFSLTQQVGSDYWADLNTKRIQSHTGESVSYEKSLLGGQHNILNIVAAVAIAETFGLSLEDIESGIARYQPLAHRCVRVRTLDGVDYFNDSKATNISSTAAAILGFPERKWLILGGVTKGQDFSILAELLQHNVAGVALIGADYSTILPHIPPSLKIFESKTLEQALTTLRNEAQSGDIVLFSPACASFDQFKGFEHRGDVFESLVKGLG